MRLIRNRIVAHTAEDPAKLTANPLNFRRHPPAQREALRGSMQELGWLKSVLVNRTTGNVIDGHARVDEAIKAKAKVPVDWVELTPEEERLALAVLDPITEMATRDTEALGNLLQNLRTHDEGLNALLETLQASATTAAGLVAGADPDAVQEPPAKAKSKRGQIYCLAGHRLMCGDATAAEDVKKLLSGHKPHLMVTDPPYGVDYDPTWRNGKGGFSTAEVIQSGKILNDSRDDWSEAWALFPGEVAYVWCASLRSHIVAASLIRSSFALRALIIWAKQQGVMSRGHYHWQHEPCWYGVRGGGTAHWSGDRTQTTVWDIQSLNPIGNREEERVGHGSQKPIACHERPILNNSKVGQFVYDPFGGSGSGLIACEKSGRRCLMMEIDPRWVDVIVKRWEEATGRKATLEA